MKNKSRAEQDKPLDPGEIEARHYFGTLLPEEMPGIALRAIEDGYDGPALLELVWRRRPTMRDVGDLFDLALREMGRSPRPKEVAGLRIARTIARNIVSGEMHPYPGALRIAWVWRDCKTLDELTAFAALASKYEDDFERGPLYLKEIVARAKELMHEREDS